MFEKIKTALTSVASTAFPSPTPSPRETNDFAVVPILRGEHHMGATDRMPDSSRPTLCNPAPPLRTWAIEAGMSNIPAQAHARHVASVSGFVAYALELLQSWGVGAEGLKPSITPVAEELGWTPEYAIWWSGQAERLFAEWACDPSCCDSQGRLNFAGLQGQALRSYMLTGDALFALDYGPKPQAAWRTSLQAVDPLRVTFGSLTRPGIMIRNGVELTDSGRAVAFHIRAIHNTGQTERIPVFGANGRRLVLHVYDAEVGAVRGVSPLAPAIGGLLQGMNAFDAAVLAAQIHALMIGTITSDLPNAELVRALGGDPDSDPMSRMMAGRVEWHDGLKEKHNDVELGKNAKVIPLSTGERLDLHGGGKGVFQSYDIILQHAIREVARACGLSYQAVSGDLSTATYASLKYSITETRPVVKRKRAMIVEPLCRWALEAVVEEAIAMGRLEFPVTKGVYRRMGTLDAWRELKRFALKSSWVGPQIEDPDALKSTRASIEKVRSGLSSLSEEIEASGRDPTAVFDQIARDRDELRKRGIFLPQHEPGRRPLPTGNSNSGGTKK